MLKILCAGCLGISSHFGSVHS